jgi:hypothetical protein
VVIGRCCSAWATELQQLQDSRPGLGQQLMLLQEQELADALDVYDWPWHAVGCVLDTPYHAAAALGIAEACRHWLQQEATERQLAAAGYPVQTIAQQLDVTLAAMGAPAAASDAESA